MFYERKMRIYAIISHKQAYGLIFHWECAMLPMHS